MMGLWASRVDDEFGWKDFCLESDFRTDDLKTSFTFTLKPGSNILTLENQQDILDQPWYHPKIIEFPPFDRYECYTEAFVDFLYLIKTGVDAVELTNYVAFKNLLYGWDCNCILVLNQTIVIPT